MDTLQMTLSSHLGRMSPLSPLLSISWIFFAKPQVQVSNGKRPPIIDNRCMTLLLGCKTFSRSGSIMARYSNFLALPFLFMAIRLKFGFMWSKRLNLSLTIGSLKRFLWSINSKFAPKFLQLLTFTILLARSHLKLIISLMQLL